MNLSNEAYDSLDKYWASLTILGYKPYEEVYKLLCLIFIEEILYGKYRYFVTEEDYNILYKLLNKIYGTSCLISYPAYKKGAAQINYSQGIFKKDAEDYIRISEQSEVRI